MSIKVIGAGMGRTGTLSLKAALEELGFSRCYHMVDVLANPEHIAVWDAAARGEPVDWDALFRGYRATVDWPSCRFFEEQMRHYPDAKVICTVRDPESWYESARRTIYYARHAFPRWAPAPPKFRRFNRMVDRVVWDGTFQGRFEDKAHALEVYRRHNEHVRRVVPADRLLVYEVSQGWELLCAFLGVPVPEGKPFPHLNDAQEFRARIARIARGVRLAGYSAMAASALIVAWLLRSWLR